MDEPKGESLLRVKISAGLAVLGGLGGALFGFALTYLGNVISGYPIPPSLGIYMTNASIFAVGGALLGPPLAWTMLRSVPLWRALLEPVVAGVVGGAAAMLLAPSFFVAAVPVSIMCAVARLKAVYPDPAAEGLLGAGAGGQVAIAPAQEADEK